MLEPGVLSVSECLSWENLEVPSMVDSNGAQKESSMGSPKLGHPQDHDLETIVLTLLCSNSPLAHVMNIPQSILKTTTSLTTGLKTLDDISSTGVNLHRVGGMRRTLCRRSEWPRYNRTHR